LPRITKGVGGGCPQTSREGLPGARTRGRRSRHRTSGPRPRHAVKHAGRVCHRQQAGRNRGTMRSRHEHAARSLRSRSTAWQNGRQPRSAGMLSFFFFLFPPPSTSVSSCHVREFDERSTNGFGREIEPHRGDHYGRNFLTSCANCNHRFTRSPHTNEKRATRHRERNSAHCKNDAAAVPGLAADRRNPGASGRSIDLGRSSASRWAAISQPG